MKNTIRRMVICLMALMLMVTAIPPVTASAATTKTLTVSASNAKISSKKMTLLVGKTSQLTVKYGSSKVTGSATYKSSNKNIATVTKKGKITAKKKGTCTVTIKYKSKSYKLKLTVHKHSYTSKVTKAATCTKAGVRTYTCSCGDSYTASIAKKGHSYNSGKVTKAATCTTAGVKTYTCTGCGKTKTESIATTGHTYKDTFDTKACYVWEWYGDPVYVEHCGCGLNFYSNQDYDGCDYKTALNNHVIEVTLATGSSNGHNQWGEDFRDATTGHYVTRQFTSPVYGKCSVCGAVDSRYVAPSDSDTEW